MKYCSDVTVFGKWPIRTVSVRRWEAKDSLVGLTLDVNGINVAKKSAACTELEGVTSYRAPCGPR